MTKAAQNTADFSPQEIVCIERRGKGSLVRLRDGREILSDEPLKSTKTALPESERLCVRADCVVNVRYIRRASAKVVVLQDGTHLTVGKTKAKQVATRLETVLHPAPKQK